MSEMQLPVRDKKRRGFLKKPDTFLDSPPIEVDALSEGSEEHTFSRMNRWAARNQESLGLPSLGEQFATLDDATMQSRFPVRYAIIERMREAMNQDRFPSLAEQRSIMKKLYVLNSLDRYISAHHAAEPDQRVLHTGQVIAFEKLSEKVEQDLTSGYFKYPMGFGKTVLFAKLVEAMNVAPPEQSRDDFKEIARTKTLIVVPTLSLVGQTMRRMEKFTPGLTIGHSTSRRALSKQNATIITHAALKSRVQSGRLNPKDFDLLLIDEAHEMITTLGDEAIAPFREHALILGFTATDEYSPGKKVSKILGEKIHSIDLQEAVDSGYICDFDAYEFDTQIDVSEVRLQANGSLDPKEMAKHISFGKRAQCSFELYEKMFKGDQGFIFVESIAAANITAEIYNNNGVSAVALTENTPNPDNLIQAFERGEFDVLVSIKIGTRGVDNDRAKFVMNLSQTGSPVQEEQRGGRALRRCADMPNKKAGIVSFVYRDKRRGDPVTFARIANREPLNISTNYDMSPDAKRSNKSKDNPAISLADLDLDAISDIDPELSYMATMEANRAALESPDELQAGEVGNEESFEQQTLEEEIFAVITDIDDVFVQFTTDQSVRQLKDATVLNSHQARVQHDKISEQKHDAAYFKLYEIEGELRKLMDQAYTLADPLFAPVVTGHITLEDLRRVHSDLLDLRILAEMFIEDAFGIGCDYDIDITDFEARGLHP